MLLGQRGEDGQLLYIRITLQCQLEQCLDPRRCVAVVRRDPFRQVLGHADHEVVVEERERLKGGDGFDAALDHYDLATANGLELVAYEGGREAAMALSPWFVPVDHAIIGIVDAVHVPGLAGGALPGGWTP